MTTDDLPPMPPQLPPHVLEYVIQIVAVVRKGSFSITNEDIHGSLVKEVTADGGLIVTPSRQEAQRFDSAEDAWTFYREKELDGFGALFQPVVRRSRRGHTPAMGDVRGLVEEMRRSAERLERLVAELVPADVEDAAQREMVEDLGRQAAEFRAGVERLETAFEDA
jgi:hypothetical protein